MKKCAVIGFYGKNEYRKNLLKDIISYFNSKNIDVIIASSDHIQEFSGVRNYITLKHAVDNIYSTEGYYAFFQLGDRRFYTGRTNKGSINGRNYFIKQHQISAYYAKLLGYDYYYFLEFDAILNINYFDKITSNDWDTSKFHVYNFMKKYTSEEYTTGFLHGNTNVATKIWSQENLEYIESIRKEVVMFGVEANLYRIGQKHINDIIYHPNHHSDVFVQFNSISNGNSAEIYYDTKNKSYVYMQHKAEKDFGSSFGAQLYIDDNNIYSQDMKDDGSWFIMPLQNYRKYTIKYYDSYISEANFHRQNVFYTNPDDTDMHMNWIDYV